MKSSEWQVLLDEHLSKRPDHLKALHPFASKVVREEYEAWVEKKHHLALQLEMAVTQESVVWKDSEGNTTHPTWNGKGDTMSIKSLQDRKKLNTKATPGRPILVKASKETIQRREQRARKALERQEQE
jgi:hypothetical protein